MNTILSTLIIFLISFTIGLTFSDRVKDKRRYMLVIKQSIKYFESFTKLKEYLSDEGQKCNDYKIFVRDDKEYVNMTVTLSQGESNGKWRWIDCYDY